MSDRASARGAARSAVAAIALIAAVAASGCGSTEPQPDPVPTSVELQYHGQVAPAELLVSRGDVLEFEIVVRDSAGARLRSRQLELLTTWEAGLGPKPVEVTVHGDSVTVRTTTAGWAAFIPRVDGWLYGPDFLGMTVQPINPTPRLTGSYTFSAVDVANDMTLTGTLDVLDTATTVTQSKVPGHPDFLPPDGIRLLAASGTIQRCGRATAACTAAAALPPATTAGVDTLGVIRLGFSYSVGNPGPCPPQTGSGGTLSITAKPSAAAIAGDFTYREVYCTGGLLSGSGTINAVR